ncbi:MAG: hypothetical protein KDE55_08615 [Novosphingobium sp.]|nr:hypothetical protein [Novosphingobium sp.]
MDRSRFHKFLRPLGALLVVLSVVFLIVTAREHWHAIRDFSLGLHQWLAIAALAIAYGVSMLLPAIGWFYVLRAARAEPPGAAHCVSAYGMAQLAKYVPGNIFHLMGRHMIHARAGLDQKRILAAAICEIVLLIGSALSIAALCVLIDPPEPSGLWRTASITVLASAGPLSVAVTGRIAGGALADIMRAFALHCGYFAVMAAIVAAIAMLLGAPLSLSTAGSGVAAWIAGFAMPGASAGLGVREAAMVLFGGKGVSTDLVFVIAALFRIVTFVGDLLFFEVALLLRKCAPARA